MVAGLDDGISNGTSPEAMARVLPIVLPHRRCVSKLAIGQPRRLCLPWCGGHRRATNPRTFARLLYRKYKEGYIAG